MIDRAITQQIKQALIIGHKIIILYGPRQAGKTTLINILLQDLPLDSFQKFIGDDLFTQDIFSRNELELLKRTVSDKKLLVIDEAQKIENIGNTLKLLIDNLPITILASGSASFDLANKVSESLAGRTKTFWLYPFSYKEIAEKYKQTSQSLMLEEFLRFGMFPAVHNLATEKEKTDYLYEYLNTYLHKDILTFENIRKPKKIIDLLSLLALQIGKEVSIAELARNLVISQKAVQNYLDVLEKMFVIINIRGFSRNLRKEIAKTSKYYFMDTGLRNALLRNFNNLKMRGDSGELFENWFIVEKIKQANNTRQFSNFYFWRTYDKKEIDLIQEKEGKLTGYECKFSDKKQPNAPKEWFSTYPQSEFKIVNPNNFKDLLNE